MNGRGAGEGEEVGQQLGRLRPEPERIRLLQLLTCDAIGGTELMVLALVQHLDPSQFSPDVALLAPTGPIATQLRGAGVRAYSLGGGGWFATIRRLCLLVRHQQYDIIHAYGFRGPFIVRFIARAFSPRTRVISGIQGLHPAEVENVNGLRARLLLALDRTAARLIAIYEANSLGAVDLLVRRGFSQNQIRYIPNAIDALRWPARFEGNAAYPPTVVNVSRFIFRKRQADLVRAAAELKDRVPCRFVLAGEGPTLGDVKALARRLGVAHVVSFPGSLDIAQIQHLLGQADVFVQPSLWEGMPASVLEAMASGVAVVGTDVNGIRDLVLPGRTGWLVEPCRPDQLARAITEALADRERLTAYGWAGRDRVLAEFDLRKVVEAKASLYVETAGRTQ